MKGLRRVIAWVCLSLVLQLGAYVFLDQYYLGTETHVKVSNMDELTVKQNAFVSIRYPDGATSIALSYNWRYTSWIEPGGQLTVVDVKTGKLLTGVQVNSGAVLSAQWLPDANILITADREGDGTIRFFSYDANKQEKLAIGDPKSDAATLTSSQDDFTVEMESSTLTGCLYLKAGTKDSYRLYRIDRNERMTRVSLNSRKVGAFKVASHDDLIAYEDNSSKVVRTTGKNKTLKWTGATSVKLAGADGNDLIYALVTDKNGDNALWYGKLSEKISAWKSTPLTGISSLDNLRITYAGDIYDATETGKLVNLKDNGALTYTGDLLSVMNGHTASIKDGLLSLN